MTDLLLGICLIALLVYGYWAMSRLDRLAFHDSGRQNAQGEARHLFR